MSNEILPNPTHDDDATMAQRDKIDVPMSDVEFLRLIDLCPFLANEKSNYDDAKVYRALVQKPRFSAIRHNFRVGIGRDKHPLAVVMALGGSLDVVAIMVEACPEALEERLSGRRTVLHYAISEGVGLEVGLEIIQYIISKSTTSTLDKRDSFQKLPLHLAATYPTCHPSVLRHILHLHPLGARALDHRSQTPLHHACKSRASVTKILPLLEAYPEALDGKDRGGSTPMEWAERNDHRLSESCSEIVRLLAMAEEGLRLGVSEDGRRSQSTTTENNDRNGEDFEVGSDRDGIRAQRIMAYFRSLRWWGGMGMVLSRNISMLSFLEVTPNIFPELIVGVSRLEKGRVTVKGKSEEEYYHERMRLHYIFSMIVKRPDLVTNF